MAKRTRSAKDDKEKRAKARHEEDAKLNVNWSSLKGFEEGKDEDFQNLTSSSEEEDGSENEMEDYELKPRTFKSDENKEDFERLPIKSADGQVHRVLTKDPSLEKKQKQNESEEEEEEEDKDEGDYDSDSDEEVTDDESVPKLSEKEEIILSQETIATAAELITEDPEENIGKLREIIAILETSERYKVKQITILALVPIFKSIIPGYRIRPLTETEKTAKTSKEVRRLRNFEEGLVSNYKKYIEILATLSKKGRSPRGPQGENSPTYILGSTAIRASCELILAVPHFNFRADLIEILVDKISSRKGVDRPFAQVIKTIHEVFKADDEGHVSNEVIRLIAKMIKARKYRVHQAIIETFLYLRLLTELNVKASMERVEKVSDEPKIKKKDRVHLSKRERKIRKENKAIEEEMRKAEASVSAEERERIQGETLKIVFVVYFNILKERSSDLMPVTLEGLAKFAHLMNAEFFGDLLEVLRELILERQTWDISGELKFKESATREALLCIVTAFALLSGQSSAGESMNLDLTFFINHFYSSLYSIGLNPDLEYSYKTLRLDDPLQKVRQDKEGEYLPKRVDISTEMEMVVEAFDFIFFKHRAANNFRAEAFSKRLMISAMHMPEKSTLAALKTLGKMTRRYNVLAGLYSTEDRLTNGVFRMDVDEPEHSNPEASTLWETVLLEKHYCPKIAKAAALVPKVSLQRH